MTRDSAAPVEATRGQEPVFIVGAPRSGTSLLRTMLNRHPSIGICDETFFFYYVYERRRAFGDLANSASRRYLVTQYLRTNRIKRLGLDDDRLSRRLMENGRDYPSFFAALLRVYAEKHGKTRMGEKTPDHARQTNLLRTWFPDSKVIHIVRDPRDVVASLLRMPWASDSVLANARNWLYCNENISRDDGDDRFLLVRYEQLVSDTAEVLKRVCAFVGEEYSPKMLESDEDGDVVEWWFQRSRGPVSKARIGVWQEHLTEDQVAVVERLVGSKMRELGYEPTGVAPSWGAARAARFGEIAALLGDKMRHLPRLWYYWLRPTQLSKEEAWIDRQG